MIRGPWNRDWWPEDTPIWALVLFGFIAGGLISSLLRSCGV